MLAPIRFASLLCAISLLCGAQAARAQAGANAPARGASGIGEIRGRLVEAGSGRAISGGSVTIRRAGRDTGFAGGALPRPDGSFRVEGLPAGRYMLRVRALGYAPLARNDISLSAANPLIDLGAVTISPVAAQLGGQTVVAEREEVTLAPDRNSYSTKNMATASGGTAVDVLRNVPSVEVDGSNKVSLRGNENVVVQINGRASPLRGEQLGTFLAQLPANSVKNVEVATNPSAKNDPEGTAGIINIVLDQEADLGLSGGLSAATSTTGMANFSGNIGRQSGPLTLFLSGSFFRDTRPIGGHTARTNLAISEPAFVESRLGGSSKPLSQSMTFRSEYRIAEHDALSADAIVSNGRFGRNSAAYYTDLDESRAVIGLFDQFSNQVSHDLTQDYTVAYRRTGKPDAKTFSTELRFTHNGSSNENDLFGVVHQADASTGAMARPRELDVTTGRLPAWNLQSDYTHPFGKTTKLESGFKGTLRSTANDFSAAYFDSTSGQFAPDASRASTFEYRERIGAAYAVLSQQVSRVQAQAGLRLEQASTRLELPSALQQYENRYASAFPSAIVSYNLTAMRQMKVSYSRRVTRPNLFQLNPIATREDARMVFRGNPALRPEYTDALELGLQETRAWGSIQLSPYLRKTAHAVRFIQTVDSSGVTVRTFDNVASTLMAGTDLNMTYRHGPLTLFGGGGVSHYTSDAGNLAGNLSTRAMIWSTRANATWKLSPRTDVQGFANYRGPFAVEGGTQSAFVFTNLALRHKLWGDQGSLALRLSDPFNLMSFGIRTADGRVIESSVRRFGARGLYVTLSRNFGQQLKLRPKQQDPEPQASPQPTSG
jgi:outer membrane cobalamin receptor